MPKATPIVHIGFPKTASTWFQKSFYPYVRSPRYIDRRLVNTAFLSVNAFVFDPDAARHTLGLNEGHGGIICEEGLCGYLHNGGVDGIVGKEVAQRIKRTLPDARIVIFLRAQPKIIAAAYQQYVRSGGTHSAARYILPSSFLSGHNIISYKQPRFDLDFFRYSRIIEHYDMLFGVGNVHVYLFEQLIRGGEDFVRGYAADLELDVDWNRVSFAPKHSSYSLGLTRVARVLNLFTAQSVLDKHHLVHIPGWYRQRRKLLERINRSGLAGIAPSPEKLLGTTFVRFVENYFAEDNRRLAEGRELPLAQFGYKLDPAGLEMTRPRVGRWLRRLAS